MSKVKLDLKDFLHMSSDAKSTRLKHKHGHFLVLAHKALSPEAQEQLGQLAKVSIASEHAEGSHEQKLDQDEPRQMYADPKVPVKKDNTNAFTSLTGIPIYGGDEAKQAPTDRTAPDKAKKVVDWYNTGTTSRAKGGEIKKEKPAGMSEQGRDVRHAHRSVDKQDKEMAQDFAKQEAHGRAKFEREIKPNVKGLAAGGPVGATPYDQGLPCLNPHCKSHGKPHPNCRCYGMAEGGHVQNLRYCAHGKPHIKGCEYLAEGGEAGDSDDIKPNSGVSAEGPNMPAGANTPSVASDAKSGGGGGGMAKIIGMFLAEGGKVLPMYSEGDRVEKQKTPDSMNAEPISDQDLNTDDSGIEQEADNNEVMGANQADPTRNIPGAVDAAKQDMAGQQTQAQSESPLASKDTPEVTGPSGSTSDNNGVVTYNTTPTVDTSSTPMDQLRQHTKDVQDQLTLDPKNPTLQQFNHENMMFMHDIANGHITPKTYHDLLFDGKGTLGKIGTLFGLLVSGAGSGLAQQPNALLHMMDNVIKNDIDAQTKSKDNAKNFIKLNQEALANKAGVRSLDAQTAVAGQALGAAQTFQSSYAHVADMVKRMPEGNPQQIAEKQKAMQALGMVWQGINAKLNDINKSAVGSAAYFDTAFPDSQGSSDTTAAEGQARAAAARGDWTAYQKIQDRTMPGVGTAPYGITIDSDGRKKMIAHQTFNAMAQRYLDFAKKNDWTNPTAWGKGQTMARELQSVLGETLGAGHSLGAEDNLTKLLPSTPAKPFNAVSVLPKIKELMESNQSRYDSLKKSYKIPFAGPKTTSEQDTAAKSGLLKEGTTGREKGTNKPTIYRNGKWEHQ